MRWAREAGFEQVSLDLIYGTPGESIADWRASIDAALACEPDHVSAYSLIVEDGTRLARQVRTGVIPAPDDDDLADKYALADDAFSAAGLEWYEVSNWARDEAARAAGTTSSTGPARAGGASVPARTRTSRGSGGGTSSTPARTPPGSPPGSPRPRTARCSTSATRALERVLLEVRLRDGLPLALVSSDLVDGVVARGLAVRDGDRLVLTRRGRLLGDAVVRELVG